MFKGLLSKLKTEEIRSGINMVSEVILVLAALISTAKLIILGITIDEEYAVCMSYRNAIGDRMFLDMWEPHQTSGFICTALIKVFLLIFHSTDYLVIFLRFSGFVIECLVAFFVYKTLRKLCSAHLSFCLAMVTFLVLPKQMLTPDFSNILIWSSLALVMSLIRLKTEPLNGIRWSIVSGVLTCLCVLAYPSCVMAGLLIAFSVYAISDDKKIRNALIYLGTCAYIGISYVAYFLIQMSLDELIYGIKQMMDDGSHSSALGKLEWMATELRNLLIPLLIVLVISGVIYVLIRKKGHQSENSTIFALIILTVSLIHQIVFWCLGSNLYLNEPLLFYYIAFIMGFFVIKKNRDLLWIGIVPTFLIWLSAMVVTNTGFRVTGTYLLPGIICIFAYMSPKKEGDTKKTDKFGHILPHIAIFLLIFALMFERGFLVIENNGYKADIGFVKQKALSGPLLNIYCRYNDGYDYNTVSELINDYSKPGDALLCTDAHSSWYMLSESRISMYSTISTPTYDDKLTEYWTGHPDRIPTLIIGREDSETVKDISLLFGDSDLLEARDGIVIYRVENYLGE